MVLTGGRGPFVCLRINGDSLRPSPVTVGNRKSTDLAGFLLTKRCFIWYIEVQDGVWIFCLLRDGAQGIRILAFSSTVQLGLFKKGGGKVTQKSKCKM
jgi:hypothetical protein